MIESTSIRVDALLREYPKTLVFLVYSLLTYCLFHQHNEYVQLQLQMQLRIVLTTLFASIMFPHRFLHFIRRFHADGFMVPLLILLPHIIWLYLGLTTGTDFKIWMVSLLIALGEFVEESVNNKPKNSNEI